MRSTRTSTRQTSTAGKLLTTQQRKTIRSLLTQRTESAKKTVSCLETLLKGLRTRAKKLAKLKKGGLSTKSSNGRKRH